MIEFFKKLFNKKSVDSENFINEVKQSNDINENKKIEGNNMSNNAGDAINNNRVGPVMRAGDVAQAAIEAAEMDNPDKEIVVEDKVAYVRISAEHELVITQESMSECLGRSFKMNEMEINLASFAGQIEATSSKMRFYFNLSV